MNVSSFPTQYCVAPDCNSKALRNCFGQFRISPEWVCQNNPGQSRISPEWGCHCKFHARQFQPIYNRYIKTRRPLEKYLDNPSLISDKLTEVELDKVINFLLTFTAARRNYLTQAYRADSCYVCDILQKLIVLHANLLSLKTEDNVLKVNFQLLEQEQAQLTSIKDTRLNTIKGALSFILEMVNHAFEPEPITIHDREARLLFCNPKYLKGLMLQCMGSRLIGSTVVHGKPSPVSIAIDWALVPSFDEAITLLSENGTEVNPDEYKEYWNILRLLIIKTVTQAGNCVVTFTCTNEQLHSNKSEGYLNIKIIPYNDDNRGQYRVWDKSAY